VTLVSSWVRGPGSAIQPGHQGFGVQLTLSGGVTPFPPGSITRPHTSMTVNDEQRPTR